MSRLPLLGCLVWGVAAGIALADSTPSARAVAFVTVDRGLQSGVRQRLQAIVRTPEQWAALWRRHSGPSAAPPSVDFAAEMVIGVFAGERPATGYEVEITRVLGTDHGLRVSYRQRTPSPGALVRPVLTSPFHLVRLPRTDLTVDIVPEPSER